MWTTRLIAAPSPPGASNVILSRDDLTFVISLDEWWIMSATEYLADKALKENDLDFKISEIYGPSRIESPLWTTELVTAGDSHDVHLLRSGETVAVISLDDWAKLSVTEFAVEDSVEVAEGLALYGSNIEDVKASFEDEEGYEDGDLDDPDSEPSQPPKRQL